MRKRKPRETRPVQPRCARPPSSSTPGPRSWSRRGGRRQNSPRRLGRGDRRLPTHDRTADARGSGRPHWICEHHGACSPGVGKTHLAISLTITPAESGRKIYFGTPDPPRRLLRGGQGRRRAGPPPQDPHPPGATLVVDEIGYRPLTQSGAVLFFQLINRSYGEGLDRAHLRQGLRGVGPTSGDEVMAAALLDRCHIVNIRGNSLPDAASRRTPPRRSARSRAE